MDVEAKNKGMSSTGYTVLSLAAAIIGLVVWYRDGFSIAWLGALILSLWAISMARRR